ncbi:MAG: hypothetical protein ABI343_09565 [Burkholderiaceae bacterium]
MSETSEMSEGIERPVDDRPLDDIVYAINEKLGRSYDDLRVRLIILNSEPRKDWQAIREVTLLMEEMREAVDSGF